MIGCGFQSAHLYFYSFLCITQFLLINLFLAMILSGFMNAIRENQGPILSEDFHLLTQRWQDYDPKATGWIEP